jgi:DNA-binding NarL/FixJ family response regulator
VELHNPARSWHELAVKQHLWAIDNFHSAKMIVKAKEEKLPIMSYLNNDQFNWGPGFNMSSVRILVVEDFAPFRQFVCSTLRERSDLQVICEASDGLEAVQKAEELKPDLIVLDIGLPTLNGLEAARRIHKLAPAPKILFVSQESSPDVVREALSLGAFGYVVKAHAGSELLAAVDAVCQGRQFIGNGLSGPISPDTTGEEPGSPPKPLHRSARAKGKSLAPAFDFNSGD